MKTLLLSAWVTSIVLIISNTQAIYAQSACPNANFSSQNFSSWEGSYGSYTFPNLNTGIVPGRHTIFSAPAFDPLTCGGLNVIPPGETNSARLGNQGTGAEAERLRYPMVVAPDNALFIYKYAVVLENPDDHAPDEQPEFSVRVLDENGMPIGGSCGTYTVYGGQPGQNFQTCGTVTWLPWTTVGIDLTPFMGQQIFVEFTTKDCRLGAHFGYAYICAGCSPLTLQMDYCAGDTQINMTAPDGFQQYTWMPGNLTGQSINIPTPAIGTVFTCTMATFSNQGNCSVDVTVTVEPTQVTASFPTGSACVQNALLFLDSSTVNNNTITGWQWDFGDGATANTQFPSHAYANGGQYTATLIATSANGCQDTTTQLITVYELPQVEFTSNGVCSNDTVHFINESTDIFPLTFEWDFGDNTQDTDLSPDHLYGAANAYSVSLTATSSVGCENTIVHLTDIFPAPAVNAGPDIQICLFTDIAVNASGAQTYVWSNSVVNNIPFTPVSGTYTVIGTDANGCRNEDSMVVSFFPQPVVDAGPDMTICLNDSVQLMGTGTTTYVWDNLAQNGSYIAPNTGNHIYELIGTDANGCSDTDQVAVLVHPLPVVNAGTDQVICQNAQVTLLATGAQNYTWTNGVLNGQPFTPTITSFYTVTGTDQYGCVNKDSTQVAFETPPAMNASFSVNSGCAPLEVTMENSSGTANDCLWSFSDGSSQFGCNSTHIIENEGCYDVTLTSTSPIGCVYDTAMTQVICVFPTPHASFQPNPYFMLETSPITTMQNSSTGAVAYDWEFGDGTYSNQTSPTHTYPEDITSYDVILTATSDHGCVDTAMATVWVEEDLIYYVPNTFTPDGDGHNESFKPVIESGFDPNSYHFYIYNRWGQQVFESEDIEDGWNGTFNGFVAQDGTYTWKIEFKSTLRRQVDNVVTGHVNILK